MKKHYVPIHMHLHCSHEPGASIEAHLARCRQVGLAHTYLTEHDCRMGPKSDALPEFFFTAPQLVSSDRHGSFGFRMSENMTAQFEFLPDGGQYALILTAENGEQGELTFYSDGKRHSDALFDRLSVEYFGAAEAEGDAEAAVDFTLSVRPPDFTAAHLVYSTAPTSDCGSHTRCLPLPKSKDGVISFPITEDSDDSTGGLDNAFSTLSLRVRAGSGGKAVMRLRGLKFHRELAFEQDRAEMTRIAAALGKKYGVTPYVTFEITEAGHHKNCYSTKVPVIDYAARNFRVTQAEAIAHVQKYGGIFCYNHPFTEWKKLELTDETRELYFEACAKNLIENRVFGATLMEVGFPSPKENFQTEYYLRLWDRLSLAGIFITGDGDSDNHSGKEKGWLCGSNFCSYAGMVGEPSEEKFQAAFRSGDLYMGDPTKLGMLSLVSDKAPMGTVFCGNSAEICFSASDIRCEGIVRRIVNGKAAKEFPLQHGAAQDAFTLHAERDFNFVRYEIWDDTGRLTGLTNPIYLVKKGVPYTAAPERTHL